MSVKQQNKVPAKQWVNTPSQQHNRGPTKQHNSKTIKQEGHEFKTPRLLDVSTDVSHSVSTSVSTDCSQSILKSVSQSDAFSRLQHPTGLFILTDFVPDAGSGNGIIRLFRLAGEQAGTGRDIRPVFGGQKHYMFCPRQAVFSVTRNRFRNRKQLARKGVENSSEVVAFYRGHRGPTRNLASKGFSSFLHQKQGGIAILAWKSGGLSPESDFKTARFRPIFGG